MRLKSKPPTIIREHLLESSIKSFRMKAALIVLQELPLIRIHANVNVSEIVYANPLEVFGSAIHIVLVAAHQFHVHPGIFTMKKYADANAFHTKCAWGIKYGVQKNVDALINVSL